MTKKNMIGGFLGIALVFAAFTSIYAQQNVRARDLFLAGKSESPTTAPAQSTSAPAQNISSSSDKTIKAPLGLRYSIMKRSPSGQYTEVDPDTTFHSGERIRLTVESNSTGYLYIVLRGSSGRWTLLFPNAEIMGGKNLVEGGNRYEIPLGTASFQFDETAGTEKLFLLLSRNPEPDFEKLVQSLKSPASSTAAASTPATPAPAAASSGGGGSVQVVSSLDDSTINKNRSRVATRDLVFEKVNEENIGAKSEKAIYVVNRSSSPEARVVVDVSLNHQ
jgi:hypothetical protein